MPKAAAVLGVRVLASDGTATRAGTLVRDESGATSFIVDEAYLQDPGRPILSLQWHVPGEDAASRGRLAARGDKIGLNGYLPPWFAGVLPEGALRQLVHEEMGPGDHDQFDLIVRLGADLPGAVLITPETETPDSAGPLRLDRVLGFKAPVPEGIVKFSLAGVQLKFVASMQAERLTAPARAGEGRYILKVASDRHPGLPRAEYAAMSAAAMVGVQTARASLVATSEIDGVPVEFLEAEKEALLVERFDRSPDGRRLHVEDAGQILGAVGERKYTMANTETVLNMVRRFSTDPRADLLEAFRRVAVDVLIGNGDNHLKNWSFWFPAAGQVRLSPAYDVVPTVLYRRNEDLALPFVGTRGFETVKLHRFRRVAAFLKLDPDWIEKEVRRVVQSANDSWPAHFKDVLGAPLADRLATRLANLPLTKECSQAG